MILEQQVTSLEISKRLKELGVKQESLFYWFEDRKIKGSFFVRYGTPPKDAICAAFTVAEVGEMLPVNFRTLTGAVSGNFYVIPSNERKYREIIIVTGSTEADARGNTIIRLLENKLI